MLRYTDLEIGLWFGMVMRFLVTGRKEKGGVGWSDNKIVTSHLAAI